MRYVRNKIGQLVLIGTVAGVLVSLTMHLIPWLPEQGSTQAERTDLITWAITYVSFVIFGWVMAVMFYAIWKFRRRDDEDMREGTPVHGHTGLEIFWTAVPTLIVTVFGVWAGWALNRNEAHAADTRVVIAEGQQFSWSFTYPNDGNFTTSTLVLPVGETVEIRTASKDVIHDFYVAEWRVKMDAVPGQFARTYATPTMTGTFKVLCAELCGPGHASMSTTNVVRVVEEDEFRQFLSEEEERASQQSPGERIFLANGCAGCHQFTPANAQGNVGPPLNDLEAAAEDAGRGNVAEYVYEAIAEPNANIAEGYSANVMPEYGGRLSQGEINDLVSYLLQEDRGGSE